MPRRARIHFVSLRSSLVNLPISIYGPLLERGIRPQNLAVHLILIPTGQKKLDTPAEAYVGWTGMASASSLAQFNASKSGDTGLETLEMDPQYAQGLGLAQDDVVEIGLLHDLPLAKSVATEPLTSDDWEIIEIHASHVESTLLSQVRVAKVGQEIDVWVLGRTRVRLIVTSVDPAVKGNALLLTTNTEVSIAPKPHRTRPPAQANEVPYGASSMRVNGIANSDSKESQPKLHSHTVRVLPARVLALHLPKHSGPELIAFVSPRTFAKLFPSALPKQDQTSLRCHKSQVRRLAAPIDPQIPPTQSTPQDSSPKILNAGATKVKDEKKPAEFRHIYVGSLKGLPSSHIIFPALPDGIQDWDLSRISPAAEPDSVNVHDNAEEFPAPNKPLNSPETSYLAGVDEILKSCTNYCVRQFLIHSSTNVIIGVSALLLTGRSGAGKTTIVRAVAKALQEDPRTFAYTHYVDASRYTEQPVPAVKEFFNYWFNAASWHKPSVLILDNLDKLLSAEVEHADSFRSRHLTEIFISIFSSFARTASLNSRGIVMIGTASSTNSLHRLINSSHIFKEIINLKPPNKDARRDILSRIFQDRQMVARDIQKHPNLNFTALATQTEGYLATDLQDLAARAIHQVAIRLSNDSKASVQLSSEDFAAAQEDFVPLSLRDVKLQKSDVAWSDIGGLQETRQILRETLEWPTKYGPIFAQSPLRLRSGLLLYGFPGCGKTLLASAVAKECGLNFISVKGPEILNKYIGASEKSVRDLFDRASAAKPCILFFDEFDSIAPKRGHDSTGVTDRVVNQMLTQMDGAEGLDGVYVLAATSRPDLIDSALLRPGRLDKSLFCNMPDRAERQDILRAVANRVSVSSSVDFDSIAGATEGFSGADLQALLYNAHLEVIHASITENPLESQVAIKDDETPVEYTIFGGVEEQKVISKAEQTALQRRLRQIQSSVETIANAPKEIHRPSHEKKSEIQEEHIAKVLKTMRPSVSTEERIRLNRIYQTFISDRTGGLPVPPESGAVGSRASLM